MNEKNEDGNKRVPVYNNQKAHTSYQNHRITRNNETIRHYQCNNPNPLQQTEQIRNTKPTILYARYNAKPLPKEPNKIQTPKTNNLTTSPSYTS